MKAKNYANELNEMIYAINSERVMLDSDLAKLYGVSLKRLNEQVKRNIERFPPDFMFQCTSSNLGDLRSQIATANRLNYWNHKRRTLPFLFTENGVAMLSSVLSSRQAIEVNISIMRAFTSFRKSEEHNPLKEIQKLKEETEYLFQILFNRMDQYEELIKPTLPKNRKRIRLKP